MAESQKGLAVKWGIQGLVLAGAIATSHACQFQSLSIRREHDTKEIRNSLGEVIGKVYYNFRRMASFSVVPSHGTGLALARDAVDAYTVKGGGTLTITDSTGTMLDGLYSGAWLVESAQQQLTNTGEATVDFEVMQYEDNNVAGVTAA